MIRIGAINIDTSHPVAFAMLLEQDTRARYTAVYNDGFRDDEQLRLLMDRFGIEQRYTTLDELARNVDIAFIHGCDWDRHLELARPCLDAGIPVFIDKPIVGNMRDCHELERLAADGAVILGSSSVRYADEITAFIQQDVSDRGQIIKVHGAVGVDEFNYGVHVVEGLGGLLGTGAISTTFTGRADVEGNVCESYCVRYDNGILATYDVYLNGWQPFTYQIITTATTHYLHLDAHKLYAALFDRILSYMETGNNAMADIPALTETIRIMLAGRISREYNGRTVALSDIPDDDPGFDGQAFADDYATKAAHISAMIG